MDKSTANAIAENAIRWCCNILTEVLGNYGAVYMAPKAVAKISTAVALLHDALYETRKL
jgi:hypothetical protein